MGIFKKKSDLAAGPDVPMDQVSAMRQQGYSNNQIMQTLQRDGYASSQVFDAMSQSEMAPSGEMPISGMGGTMNEPYMQQMPGPSYGAMPTASSEEMIEAIIDEKWNELVKDINKVIEWKQKADMKLTAMEQQMTDMKDQFDKLHQAIIGKINDYDKHILDVGSELQAMEKVFSKVLPSFIDNVNELSKITENMKTVSENSKQKPKN